MNETAGNKVYLFERYETEMWAKYKDGEMCNGSLGFMISAGM